MQSRLDGLHIKTIEPFVGIITCSEKGHLGLPFSNYMMPPENKPMNVHINALHWLD